MFKNYLKLAFRNIGRKKLYSIINIAGLGVASAFCILVFLYVQHEKSFDRFHSNEKLLYRLEFSNVFGAGKEETKSSFFSFMMKNSEQKNLIQTPTVLSLELKKNFSEIEHAIRIMPGYEAVIRVNNQSFKEEKNIAYVDSDFFNVFNFPLKEGNPSGVLGGRNQIVLSEKAAAKYFGKELAVGKTVLLAGEDSTLLTISGVAKDFPANSSFQFDLIIPRESTSDYNGELARGLNTFSDLLILQLKKGTNVSAFEKKLNAFASSYFQATLKEWAAFPGSTIKPENFHVYLRPYAEAHYNTSSGWGHYTDLKNIYQLICLAVIILFIACLNYVLLTLTSTVSRSQEVGIRKTVGAPRKQIILQFYAETQLLAFLSVLIGFAIAITCLPFFSTLIASDLQLTYFSAAEIIISLFAFAIGLGVLAGTYPAWVMSGLKPLNMMRKYSVYRLNPFLAKILACTQFSVCIILIISSFVISRQMRYMNQKELGFDKDQVVAIQNPYGFTDLKNSLRLKERLFHYASSEPEIQNITSTYFPYEGYNNTNNHIIGGEKFMVHAFDVDYNYFSFYEIPIIKGRSFSIAIPEDSAAIQLTDGQHIPGSSTARQNVVVNETLYNLLGHPPLNEMNVELGGRIIGVCKDYHSEDLTKKIAPAYHRINKRYIGYFSIKINAGQNIPKLMEKIRINWNRLTAGSPFSYAFLDENVAKSYNVYLRWMNTVKASCLLAIIIACLGLFGISGLTTVNRTKEIGIRKVLGAGVNDLFLMLNRDTFFMVFASFIVAIPVVHYLINQWLQNFAYRIKPDWSLFVLSGLISLFTAFIAVSYHTIKTAVANPVKSLRAE